MLIRLKRIGCLSSFEPFGYGLFRCSFVSNPVSRFFVLISPAYGSPAIYVAPISAPNLSFAGIKFVYGASLIVSPFGFNFFLPLRPSFSGKWSLRHLADSQPSPYSLSPGKLEHSEQPGLSLLSWGFSSNTTGHCHLPTRFAAADIPRHGSHPSPCRDGSICALVYARAIGW